MSDTAKTGLIAAAILAGFTLVAGALVFSSWQGRDAERFRIVETKRRDYLIEIETGSVWRYYRDDDPKTGLPISEGFKWLPVQADPFAGLTAEDFKGAVHTPATGGFNTVEEARAFLEANDTNAATDDLSDLTNEDGTLIQFGDPARKAGGTN